MPARIGAVIVALLLVVGVREASAQVTCDEKCKSIFIGGLFQGYECTAGTEGFDCEVNESGCVIERTGCGGETEDETLAVRSTLENDKGEEVVDRFGFGFLRDSSGQLMFAMVPCPRTERELFAIEAAALFEVTWTAYVGLRE